MNQEQAYVSKLYRRLDELRTRTAGRIQETLQENGGTAQARTERDVAVHEYSARLARLKAAENRLCFGRLDLDDGERRHIGRIGLPSDDDDSAGDPLLIDWRAPAARPFYAATPATAEGVHRRRHIVTRGRRVVRVDDEVLDGSGTPETLAGEGALLASVDAVRTGRMHDIVATLQAEQDAIVRDGRQGVLVVQGGPGTGKTAVALHRAAYLLYHHPRVAARGVLVVGPNPTFLGYIGDVLPGLGETSVLLSTVTELFPGVTADRAEPEAVAELKGRSVMAKVLADAMRRHQAPAAEVAASALQLEGRLCAGAADRARASGLPHNQARTHFVDAVLDELAQRHAEQTRALAARLEAEVADVLAEADVDRAGREDLVGLGLDAAEPAEETPDVRRSLEEDPDVQVALDALWPVLTPQRLLRGVLADPQT
ncbi:MAG TPA: hypothetical protein VGO89_05195, partial [Streptomyces sp.]|nr:hypothetical protein [Streptomyces sp.]